MQIEKKYYYIGGALALLLLLGGALLFKGGGANLSNKPVELVWWKTFDDSANVQDIIDAYQAARKNVKITFVKKDIVDYEKNLIDALASGTGPDIFTIHNDWLPKQFDKISPMPETAMTIRQYKDTFVDVAAADFIKDNRIFALPMGIDVLAAYYNKDLFNSANIFAAPKTWPELVEIVDKLTIVGKPGSFTRSGVSLGISGNINRAVDILTLLMLQNGTKFYADDFRSVNFNQQSFGAEKFNPGVTALEFFTQFANPGKTTYTWNSKSDFNIDAFTQGKLALMFGYSYLRPAIRDKAPNLNWEVAAIPQTAEDAPRVNYANYWGETVSRTSKNPAAAWEFLKFVTQKDNLQKYYAKRKQPSSRKDILAEQARDPELGVFAENALSARSVYKKDAAVYENIFNNMIDDVILRNFTASEAIQNAASQMNLILQKE